MTTHDDPNDEFLSAVFDGETVHRPRPDDQLHAVEDTFARYRALGDALRAVPEPPGELDALRAKVLATAGVEVRPARDRRDVRWLGAAAAGVLVVAGFVALVNRSSDSTTDASAKTQTAAGSAELANATAADGATSAAGAAPSSGARSAAPTAETQTAGPQVQLGTFATVDELAAGYRSRTTAGVPAPAASGSGASSVAINPCGRSVLAAAVLGTTPVVLVADDRVVAVVDQRSCEVLGRFVP